MNKDYKKVAILVSANLLPGHGELRDDVFELEEEIGKLRPAFADNGMELSLVDWREAPACASDYDAMLPLFVWDYFEGHEQEFMTAMAQVCQQTQLLNRFDVITWNANKEYLNELESLGAPTIPTYRLERVTEAGIARAFEHLACEKIVIKPEVGGGAWRQVLYEKGAPLPDKDLMPPSSALVQPFLRSVQDEGEFSFLYFGGHFSHAVLKRPKAGDYRVQSLYGGHEEAYSPTAQERTQARAVLDVLSYTPLYARIDLLRGDHGRLLLIELEMIEPYLYLPFAEGAGADNKGAQRLAKALVKAMDKVQTK